MNVIFLDFDGVIDTYHYNTYEDVEKRIKILSEIVKENNCVVVIEASAKEVIDEETMEVEGEWLNFIFSMFKKYGIKCIGRTPSIRKKLSEFSYLDMWKEDEIISYLKKHKDIDHFCVIDDDDLGIHNSDLNKVRDYLVKTEYYSEIKEEEGLLEKHKDDVKKILVKENKFR